MITIQSESLGISPKTKIIMVVNFLSMHNEDINIINIEVMSYHKNNNPMPFRYDMYDYVNVSVESN